MRLILKSCCLDTLFNAIALEELDDFAACKIERTADIADLFVPNFYFGCEPDDPTVTYAFAKAKPFGAKLDAVLSSDISHFDVRSYRLSDENRSFEQCK